MDGVHKKDGPWLHAWHDPVASIRAHSSCVRLADLNGESSHVLLVADLDKKMKVYKGTSVISEHQLLDQPVALCVFYTDNSVPRAPAIGVAAGSYVFIFRHLRPYFKFNLPPIEIDQQDMDIWAEMTAGAVDAIAGRTLLSKARDSGVKLSSWSVDLLSIENDVQRQYYVDSKKGVPHQQHTVVTCMETMKKNSEADDAVSSLVIGTESGQLLILDPAGSSVLTSCQLPSVPSLLSVSGLYDVEWRINVACRDGKIYTVKVGDVRGKSVLTGTAIELETAPNSIARIDKHIFVSTMDAMLQAFHIKGRKAFGLQLPCPATNLGVARMSSNRVVEALIATLSNGEVRLYNQKKLIHTLKLDDAVSALRWGQFGREVNSCVFIGRGGSLTLKMMSRSADLEGSGTDNAGPPPEQDVPLKVPKKTRLYVEQAEREVGDAVRMHRTFQRDLCRLRLATARAYVKVITSGEAGLGVGGGGAGGGNTQVRLNASVVGLGPIFKIKIELCNGGMEPLRHTTVCFALNTAVYNIEKPTFKVPILLPNIMNSFEVSLKNISPEGVADVVRVILMNPNSSVPLVSAAITMPISEIAER